jgi:hypothetical protein
MIRPKASSGALIAVSALLLLLIAERSDSQAGSRPRRVLFVGNSVTYFHNMPDWVGAIVESLSVEPSLRITKAVIGGATFTTHISDKLGTGGLAAIRRADSDVVILQDAIEDPLRHSDFYSSLKTLVEESKRVHAEVILFETFAFAKGAVAYLPEEKWSGGSPSAMQAKIRSAYIKASQNLKVRLAPVGDAFEIVLTQNPDIELYENDKLHPSSAGSYLIACLFVAMLTGKDPRSTVWLPDLGVKESEAKVLRAAAAAAVGIK